MSRVRIDIDELLRLRNVFRRVGTAQLTIAVNLRRLERELIGHLLLGLPDRHGDNEPRIRAGYRLVERLRQVASRLEFVVSPSYGQLAYEAQDQLVDLAKSTRSISSSDSLSWFRSFHAAATGAFGARLGGILADRFAHRASPPLVYAEPVEPRGAGLGASPTIVEVFARLGTLRPGEVEIIPVASPLDGVTRYVVLIRGIGSDRRTPNNLDDAILASRKSESSHSLGVLAAMVKAGIPKGAAVMLVGHSQGGITAMNLAANGAVNDRRDPSGYFRITHVLAAGSPIGNKAAPPRTTVLAVENTSDVVPDLDGEEEPSRLGRSVYRFSRGSASFGAAHGLTSGYLPELASARFAADPRVERYLASAEPYLGASPGAPRRFELRSASTPPGVDAAREESW